MSTLITLEEAQAKLAEIIAQPAPGEDVVITQDAQPIAAAHRIHKERPRFGSCKGMLTIVAEDEEHLEDFQEYMTCITPRHAHVSLVCARR